LTQNAIMFSNWAVVLFDDLGIDGLFLFPFLKQMKREFIADTIKAQIARLESFRSAIHKFW
jgi:hypothetical protein